MKLLLGAALVVAVAAMSACTDQGLTGAPEVRFLYVMLPGNDTIMVDLESGDSPEPITLFSDADVSTAFFTSTGVPDGRVTETDYQINIVPANTSIVTFERISVFTGTFRKVAVGSTIATFTLVRISDAEILFNTIVPIDVH